MGKPLNAQQLESVSNLSGLLLNSANQSMSSGRNKEVLLNEVKKASQDILGNAENYPELLDILLTSTQNGSVLSAEYANKLKTDHGGMFGEGSVVNAAMASGYKQLGQVNRILKSVSTSELTYENVSKFAKQMSVAMDPNKLLQPKVLEELLSSKTPLNTNLVDPQFSSGSLGDIYGKMSGSDKVRQAAAGLSSGTEELLKLKEAQSASELKTTRARSKIGMDQMKRRGEAAKRRLDVLDSMDPQQEE